MKHRNKAGKHHEDAAENNNEHSLAADFHAVRINQEAQFQAAKDALNNPQGNDEFEQRIAEDVNLNTNRMVAEAAFFIAEKRGVSGILCKRGWVKGWPSVLQTG